MTERSATIWEWPRAWRGVLQGTFDLSVGTTAASGQSGRRTVYGPYKQLWTADLTMSDKRRQEVQEVEGFIRRLRGRAGLVRMVDYFRMQPAYNKRVGATRANFADGSTWDDGGQWVTGALPPFIVLDEIARFEAGSAVFRELPESVEQVFCPGDRFELRPNGIPTRTSNYYEVTDWSRSNADGKTRVYFEPPLRQRFAVGDQVVLRDATCVMGLANDDTGRMTRMAPVTRGSFALSLIEETQ